MPRAGARRANAAPPEAERRTASRADLVIRVSYSSVDEIFSEFARNINEGGMFIETDNPHAVGAEVSIHFSLPGCDRPIAASGRVAWVSQGGPDEPAGMGLRFEQLDPATRRRINELVRKLRRDGRQQDASD